MRYEVAVTPARTIDGLMAKLAALADAYGLEGIEDEAAFLNSDSVYHEGIAISIVRDFARMGARSC